MRKINFTILFLMLATILFSQTSQSGKADSQTVQDLVNENQILLTNLALFKNHKCEMSGASAFLINYKSKIFAVTAQHLLGEAMGIKPEIKVRKLNKKLTSWKMFPRVEIDPKLDTVIVDADNLNYDSLSNDILLLEVTSVASLKAHCQLIRIGVCVFLYFSLLKQLFYWGFVEYVSRENL